MNKQEFMNILQARLAHVNPAWRDEVLSDLDEHFVQAAANGCSEEEAAAHLGDPVELAQQFYEEAALAGQLQAEASAISGTDAIIQRRAEKSSPRKMLVLPLSEANPEEPTEKASEKDSETEKSETSDSFKCFDLNSISHTIERVLSNVSSKLSSMDFSIHPDPYVSDEKMEQMDFAVETLDKVYVNILNANVTVRRQKGFGITVRYSASIPNLEVMCADGVLTLSQKKRQLHSTRSYLVEILLPTHLSPSFDMAATVGDLTLTGVDTSELLLHTTAGDISFSKATCYGNAKIDSVSGDLEIHAEQICGDLKLKSVSGDITADIGKIYGPASLTTNAGDIDLRSNECFAPISAYTTSGDLSVNVSSCQDTSLRATSGDVHADFGIQGGSFESSSISGSLDLSWEKITGNIQVKTTSSDISLMLPSAENFQIQASSNFGEVSSPLPLQKSNNVYRYGNGPQTLQAATLSGNIRIQPFKE